MRKIAIITALFLLTAVLRATLGAATAANDQTFYVPENPRYTIIDSALDSIRFTVDKTVHRDPHGHLVSISTFVDSDANVMGWHDFGNLEGPGWVANSFGGAGEIYRVGAFCRKSEWKSVALSVLDHGLDDGFIDPQTGFIRGYRDSVTGKFCLNYKHNSDWFCPGSMAKMGYQLLVFADDLGEDPRAARMRQAAVGVARWISEHVDSTPNGWFPRRTTPEGKLFKTTPKGAEDIVWQSSADGLYILQLDAALTARKLADYSDTLRQKTGVFVNAGGFFGSINQDTYDLNEDVAYAVGFRTLVAVARVLRDDSIKKFAYEHCLDGLERFKIREDRNHVATKGLLYMEDSWDTCYLWENAEAALAYFEAAKDFRPRDARRSREYELNGLTILRAIAKHHHGTLGFLTEGVDWNNHVGQKHHFDGAQFGDIRYTEPFLNNQHIAEPTLFYLENLARKSRRKNEIVWRDAEGTAIFRQPSVH